MAKLISPFLGSFRFSKNYRQGTSVYYKIVYRLIDVVLANTLADTYFLKKGN